MLTEEQLIDNVNPFVVSEFSLPGTWSEAMPFGKYTKPIKDDSKPPCAVEANCETKDSPICGYGITAGDRTIDMCRPSEPNCAMSRRLVPERNIDEGRWSLPKVNHKQKELAMTGEPDRPCIAITTCIIIISALIMISRGR